MEINFHLEVFDGPLDLLLSLIAKNKVNIYDIPIADILQQYLAYLEQMQQFDMTVAADFVTMAAQLTYIKSKMLLPRYEEEQEDDPRAALVEALLEYKRIKEAGERLALMGEIGRDIFVKPPEQLTRNKKFEGELDIAQLISALESILERDERKVPPPITAFSGIVGREVSSVNDKISMIIDCLVVAKSVNFTALVLMAKTRSDIVAIFLAVLELSKTNKVIIEQEQGDYMITLGAVEG